MPTRPPTPRAPSVKPPKQGDDLPRTTLSLLAQKAGVHHTTVSRALRNHPGISRVTRDRIKALARAEGYAPDPFLSALTRYRRNVRLAPYKATLSWVFSFEDQDALARHNNMPEYMRGVSRRGQELGFRIDEAWLSDFNYNGQALSAMLKARGIVGLLIPTQPKPGAQLWLDWDSFASVTFGFTLTQPVLHRVAVDQYGAILKLTQRLVNRGFKRPCFVLPGTINEKVRRAWSAGFWSVLEDAGLWRANCLFRPPKYEAVSLMKWIDKAKPDVVVSLNPEIMLPLLQERGISVPGDFKVAGVALRSNEQYFGGITENGEELGVAAVEILSNLLYHGEFGLPAASRCTMVEGEIRAGVTLPDI